MPVVTSAPSSSLGPVVAVKEEDGPTPADTESPSPSKVVHAPQNSMLHLSTMCGIKAPLFQALIRSLPSLKPAF